MKLKDICAWRSAPLQTFYLTTNGFSFLSFFFAFLPYVKFFLMKNNYSISGFEGCFSLFRKLFVLDREFTLVLSDKNCLNFIRFNFYRTYSWTLRWTVASAICSSLTSALCKLIRYSSSKLSNSGVSIQIDRRQYCFLWKLQRNHTCSLQLPS